MKGTWRSIAKPIIQQVLKETKEQGEGAIRSGCTSWFEGLELVSKVNKL